MDKDCGRVDKIRHMKCILWEGLLTKMKIIFLGLTLISIGFFFSPQILFHLKSPNEKLSQLVVEDLQTLHRDGHLPKSWKEIRSISVKDDSKEKQNWLTKFYFPFTYNPTGLYHLEMQVLPWADEVQKGIVINYYLIHLESKNTVWEFGRTFAIETSPDKVADHGNS